MAQNALPPGATRRRAAFGMLDADGWGWAGVKATFWFLTIIFLLGYIPNLVYYATVSDTVEVGANFISPVNWCPASNKDLPCPAPAGAVVPWESSPAELDLPEALAGAVAVQSGTNLYLVGGTLADGTVNPTTYATSVTLDGNFHPWTEGPALPEPRSGAAYASLAGVPYVIGGMDASGNATTTVFIGVLEKGALTGWQPADGKDGRPDLTLPTPISGASAAASVDGIWLLGGRTDEGISNAVLRAQIPAGGVSPGAWEDAGVPLRVPVADAAATFAGDYLFLFGGMDAGGATAEVQRLWVGTRQRRQHPRGVAVKPTLGGIKAGRLLAAHGMAANRLHSRRQRRHGRTDLGLGAAHVHHHCARLQVWPDLVQQIDDGPHRCGQDDDVGAQHAGNGIIGG